MKLLTMMAKYLSAIYVVVFISCVVKEIENTSLQKLKSGPYKLTLQSIRRCAKPKAVYEKHPSAVLNLEAFNNTSNVPHLRGNFTILKDTSQWKGKAKQFIWLDGKWRPSIVLHSSGCQGILVKILVTILGAEYDYSRCAIKQGTYVIQELDINKVGHFWTPTLVYGKEMWRDEVTSPEGLVDCWEFYDIVEPL